MRNPCLFQVHAMVFLRRLEKKYAKKLTLLTIPSAEWEAIIAGGFNLLWLMGVWERSPFSKKSALAIPELREVFDRVLPGWTDEDVSGSPYAIKSYTLDARFGAKKDLAELKKKLNKLGLGLILDFVPNHLATDHDWIEIPERFIRGTQEDLEKDPTLFFKGGKQGLVTAHGKDPYFPGWQDTAQINIFSNETRRALTGELFRVAAQCDGVRCDMAMLLLNRIFRKTWDGFLGVFPEPESEFWPGAIQKVKETNPDFIFIAEVYWDLERDLQSLGFDFTYDKKFYDLLRGAGPGDIKNHLSADLAFQERSVRFIENHDEERAIVAFGREKSFAAAAVIGTLPGLRFFHEGQREGYPLHFPIQLGRLTPENPDRKTVEFYKKLFKYCATVDFRRARWNLLETLPLTEFDESHKNLLCWMWKKGASTHLVVINYSGSVSGGKIRLPGRKDDQVFSSLSPWQVNLIVSGGK